MDDIWPQRTIYRAHLEDYLRLAKQTQAQFCEEIGLSLDHFRNALYRPEKRLGLDALQRSSAVFSRLMPGKCSVSNYIDDPGALLAGQDVSYLSDQARFFASLQVKDLVAEDLTDDDRRYLYEDHLRAMERLRGLHAHRVGGRGPNSTGANPEPAVGGTARPGPRRSPRPRK